MLIDWFTVVAQAINFLILVWLMKRFLYRPILHAIDEREKKIAAELADADAKRTEARRERDEFSQKNAELAKQRIALISQATREAEVLRQRLIGEARQAADDFTAKRQESLENDARNLNQTFIRRTQQEVFAIARQALADLAGASLEDRMSEAFIARLRGISGSAKAELTDSFELADETAVVRSAFPVRDDQRKQIQEAIDETFGKTVRVRFETVSDVISGIELTAGGKKLAWSIADYLGSLETVVGELLQSGNGLKTDLPKGRDEISPAVSRT